MPHAMPVCIVHVDRPCGAEMSGISRSSRTTTVESSMKSEHNLCLACEDSPKRAFFFWTFFFFLLALLASTVHWHRCFLFLNIFAISTKLYNIMVLAIRFAQSWLKVPYFFDQTPLLVLTLNLCGYYLRMFPLESLWQTLYLVIACPNTNAITDQY